MIGKTLPYAKIAEGLNHGDVWARPVVPRARISTGKLPSNCSVGA
jgi:hypothetical protein